MAEDGKREGRDEGRQDRHGERMTKWQRAVGSGVIKTERRTWGGEGVGGIEAGIRKMRVGLLKCSLSCGLSTDAQ